jgi:two-component system sensor histidine kinase/response regulator
MTSELIKFLLVDDTAENLVALEALIRRKGLELLLARSGLEALELLLVHDVSLALLDVQMPMMDGFELAELMRGTERTKHVPIIFVTAGARDPQRVFRGYESGAVDFLFKPIDPHILKSKADVFFELARERREVSQALRLNEMFVGILGHDLRNPLGALMVGTEMLGRQIVDEAQLRTLRRMTAAGHRMTEMIEQLLDLTRARLAGGLGLWCARKHLDVGDLVRRAVDELRATNTDREIVIEVDGDCTTWGDPDRLLQLFSNLVGNAIHHGTQGGPISLSIAGGEREIVILIRNSGVIPSELLPALFEPFRGRTTTSSSRPGALGLGLFISQQIARAHDGDIGVDSSSTGGTVFAVRLPRRREHVTQRNAAEPLKDNRASTKIVLIVEDEEHIRESLREALEDEGYRAVTASSGLEALDLLVNGGPSRPDLVILDLVLPVIGGEHLYQAIRENANLAGIPVIVSTSSPASAHPGVRVVSKPLNLERVIDLVAELWPKRGSP